MGELLGLMSALLFGIAGFFARKGTESMPMGKGMIVSLLANALLLVPISLVQVMGEDRSAIPIQAVMLFALAGVFGSLLGRMAGIGAIARLGPSRATIYKSLQPIITAAIALTLLNEPFTIGALAGGALMMIGLWYVSAEPPSAAEARPWDSPPEVRVMGIALGLTAALCYASTNLVRKVAMGMWPAAFPGAAIGVLISLTVIGLSPGALERWRSVRPPYHRGHLFFIGYGFSVGLAQISFLFSLLFTPVWVTNLFSSTEPLMVMLISFVVFRGQERLNRWVFVGASLTVIGMIIMIVLR